MGKYSERDVKMAEAWAKALCEYSNMDEEFFRDFYKRLTASEGVYEEFIYYMNNQNFLCKFNVRNITVTDILVYQVDRFKAGLDDFDKRDMKYNPDKMLLMAFDTMLKAEKDPEKYAEIFRTQTGTDYEGKF